MKKLSAALLVAALTATSALADSTTQGYGDPDCVRVVPPSQYLKRYVFFTDSTYPETNLVVVRKRRNLLMKILVDLVEKEYEPGELIFTEGAIGKALYIILDGSVAIAKKSNQDLAVLAELQAGSYFGELALIDQMPRFATASAKEKTTLLIMYKSYFDDLIKGSPAISSRVLLNLVGLLATYDKKEP